MIGESSTKISDRAAKRLQTKLKRKSQKCQVFELKIDHSKLSKKVVGHLSKLFLEAKWYYNYVLSNKNIDDAQTKIKLVPVKVGDIFENRELAVLTAQMRQDIKARTFGSLKSLKALKNNGHQVGRLKFKSRVGSVPLRQLGRTFSLNFDESSVKVQGLKTKLRVRGLEQITEGKEIANATLVRKCNDFYIHVTTFEDKKNIIVPNTSIGIDFGCETQLTLSDGTKIEFQVPVSKRLRRLDRKIDKYKRKKSNNRRKDQKRRQKLYERLANKKRDIRNKVVSVITRTFKYVCIQRESINGWKSGGHGKKIQNSGIGAILCDLKNKAHVPILVDRFFPSTQLCPQCGKKNKLEQGDRIYKCECGFIEDRDIKAARCIEVEGMKQVEVTKVSECSEVPTDCREVKLEESSSSVFFDLLNNIHGIKASKKSSTSQEATGFILL